jgi:hypothetical protein
MGGGSAVVRSTRFQTTPIRFSVPASLYNALSSTGNMASARLWDTMDLNGDGRVDLVLTSNPATGAVFVTNNVTHWNVHLGTPTGFSGTITQWVVPSNLLVAQGYNSTFSATGTSFWVTMDMTGDGRPDLVHTMNPSGGPYVSLVGAMTDGWLMRRGGPAGFDLTMVTFSVPRVPNLAGGIDRAFNDTATRRWALAEVTGDSLVDLVVTADPLTDNVWLTNGPQWVVCPGSATGFPAFGSCQRASVPDNGVAGGLKSASSFLTSQRRVWQLLDLNGDGALDIVQPMNPSALTDTTFLNGTTPAWRVWLNQQGSAGGTSFDASPTLWAVPSASHFTTSSAAGLAWWDTFDLDGDRVPELVVTADPSTGRPFGFGTATASWRVYGSSGRGFATLPATWPIPVGPNPDGFRSRSGTTWAVLDVTGDGRADLVQFQDPLTGLAFSDVSGAFWRVYPGLP